MAYSEQQIADLRSAIAEGVLEVESVGRRVKYRNLNEMQRILALMEGELAAPSSSDYVGQKRTYIEFHRA